MNVDVDARNYIIEMANRLHEFGCQMESREIELWGWLEGMLRAPKVHQLVAQVKSSIQDTTAQFAQEMLQHVGDEVAKLVEELAAFRTFL